MVSRTRRGQEGDITEEYEATSGSGNFVQSLVCTDGFMENIYTYILCQIIKLNVLIGANFYPSVSLLYLNKDDENKKLEK